MCITTDNATSNGTFLKEMERLLKIADPTTAFNQNHSWIRCMAHVINLAAQKALESLKVDLQKVISLIKLV